MRLNLSGRTAKLRPAAAKKSKVLVVEDDPGVQALLRAMLCKMGFEVTSVSSITKAKKALRRRSFNLIFLDLMLSDGTGDEVFYEARKINPTQRVIIATGAWHHPILAEMQQEVTLTVLKKPLTFAAVAAAVKWSPGESESREMGQRSSAEWSPGGMEYWSVGSTGD
jgi:DNA-binding NtrC family response regulator